MALIRIRKVIDEPGADRVVDAAEEHALAHGYRVVIAVVDPYGELIQLRRTPGAQLASSRVAVDKARTAAIFMRPSRALEEQVSTGRLGALALRGAAALTGGIPLTLDGELVGAIGTSGETPDQDESVSLSGAQAAFSSASIPILTQDGARVVADAVAAEAGRRAVFPVAAVVDAGGELLYLWRSDGAQVASVGVAADKGRTERATSRCAGQAASGCSHRTGTISERCTSRRVRTTSPGAPMTVAPSTSRRSAASTGCGWASQAFVPSPAATCHDAQGGTVSAGLSDPTIPQVRAEWGRSRVGTTGGAGGGR